MRRQRDDKEMQQREGRLVQRWLAQANGAADRGTGDPNATVRAHGSIVRAFLIGGARLRVAIQERLDGKVVDWMEHASDEQYRQ